MHSRDVLDRIDPDLVREFNATLSFQWQVQWMTCFGGACAVLHETETSSKTLIPLRDIDRLGKTYLSHLSQGRKERLAGPVGTMIRPLEDAW